METELRVIRDKLINKALFFAIIFIYPILCASIIRIFYLGWTSLFYFHIVFTIAITWLYVFRKKISLETKVFLFSLVFFSFSFVGSLYFGLAAGLFFYVFVVIINTIILGQKKGILALFAAFAGLVIAAVLHSSGILRVTTNLNAYTASFNPWISYIIAFLFVFIVSVLTIGLYNTFFVKNTEALQAKIAEHENAMNEIKMAKALLEKQHKELQNLNAENQIAKEKAQESDRLKTAFLHNVSHEIRTPLNAIVGFADLLGTKELSEEKKKKYLAIVTNNCYQLLTIITDILTISAIETNQEELFIEKVCINQVLTDLESTFGPLAASKHITLSAHRSLTDSESMIYTDKSKINQILTKLLSNAFKFTNKGYIELGYRVKNSDLEFFVSDSGIGIKPEFQKIIFERFNQAKLYSENHAGGTGLGLSISKGVVNLMGGQIWVESEPERGSTFWFTVPYKTTM